MLTSKRTTRGWNTPFPIRHPVLEGLEHRMLLSAAISAPVPPAHTTATAGSDDAEYVDSRGDDSGENYSESDNQASATPAPPPPPAIPPVVTGHLKEHTDDVYGPPPHWQQDPSSGHTSHDPGYLSGDGTTIILYQPKDDGYYHSQSGSVSYTVQPAYVSLPGAVAVTGPFVRVRDQVATAFPVAAPAPAKPAVSAPASPTTPRTPVSTDSTSITTSTPQRTTPSLAQPFAVTPISQPMTASTRHMRIENTLLLDTWKLGVATFSQTPIITAVDWEVAAATNTVSEGAEANFVENLIASDAAALARVANTVAYRLYEENALLWKEMAALIGAAMMIGGYMSRTRSTTQTPPQNEVRAGYRCIGEPE
jgi:hypothetical protein